MGGKKGEPQKPVNENYREGWDRIFARQYPEGWPEKFPAADVNQPGRSAAGFANNKWGVDVMFDMTAPPIDTPVSIVEYDRIRTRKMYQILKLIDQAWQDGNIVKPRAQHPGRHDVDRLMDVELRGVVGC